MKLRPIDKDDIFVIPEEMKSLMEEPEKNVGRRKRVSGKVESNGNQKNITPPDSTSMGNIQINTDSINNTIISINE